MPHITVTEPPDDDQGHGPSASTTRATSPSESRPSSSSTADHSTAPLHLAVPQAAHTTTSSRGGRDRSGSSVTMPETTLLNPDHPPPLDSWHFSLKGPLIYLVFLLVCNVLIPCLLYYLLRENTHLTDKELIGIGSAALGVSSCFDAPLRFWRLTRHRAKYGPLYYPHAPDPAFEPAGKRWLPKEMPRSFWHLDFTMWCYQAGLFAMAVPLAIAPAVPLFNFYLFSLAMLVIPPMIIFTLTLKVWHTLPFWCSSDPPRTPTKPACYYALEDVGAVDFKHGREWRKRCQARYAASPPFRAMMWYQTLLWAFGMAVFVSATAAVDWTADLDFAFGFVLGLFFVWALAWGLVSYLHVHWSLQRELKWWRAKYASTVVTGLVPHDDAHAPSLSPRGERPGEGNGKGAAGVEREGQYRGGRTRGYSVHARLEVSPQVEMTQVARGGGTTGADSASAAGRVV
ncbi:hypothetical protein DMC30DRAFT_447119 [Rhodotorula diobovata]|uniref:Uncharacterized protein n=1 Tax=Rhodotorula diobovata TaxID=5288 RepID=A0A5C5FWI2_9BASI|nr:hypothetical protein DMC30DRAFT_447119 [Rhodotorula diobovata]